MSKYTECPNCGHKEARGVIYYCRDCDTYFCEECVGDEHPVQKAFSHIGYGAFCPNCSDGGYIGAVAHMEDEDDESSDDDESEDRDEDS